MTVNEVRVALAAALLSSDQLAASATVLFREDEAIRLDTIQRALHLRAHARAVLTACAGPLATEWHMSEVAIQMVLAAVASVLGGTGSPPLLASAPVPTSPPRAVAQGMPVAGALAAFAQVSSGQFSHDDKCFFP